MVQYNWVPNRIYFVHAELFCFGQLSPKLQHMPSPDLLATEAVQLYCEMEHQVGTSPA